MLISCNKNSTEEVDPQTINGIWVEKFPKDFDGISDTIQFNSDKTISKHFYFKNWKYEAKNDSLLLSNDLTNKIYFFRLQVISNNEIVINNFIDRSLATVVKNINYIKLKSNEN